MLHHVLVDVLVAHLGLGVVDAQLVEGLVQAEIGHDGGDHGVHQQLAPLLHVAAVDVEDVVAGDDVALLVHAQAAVGIAVIGEAHIKAVVQNEFPQTLDVGGAGVGIDVVAVGVSVDDVGLRAQGIEDALGDVPGSAVGAVETHLLALEGILTHADQVADVAVTAGDVVDGAADLLPLGQGQLRPFLAEDRQLAVEIGLDEGDDTLVHLLAEGVDELDAVVGVGVVGGGDHDAAVEILGPGHEGDGGGGGDVQQVPSDARQTNQPWGTLRGIGNAVLLVMKDPKIKIEEAVGNTITVRRTGKVTGGTLENIKIHIANETYEMTGEELVVTGLDKNTEYEVTYEYDIRNNDGSVEHGISEVFYRTTEDYAFPVLEEFVENKLDKGSVTLKYDIEADAEDIKKVYIKNGDNETILEKLSGRIKFEDLDTTIENKFILLAELKNGEVVELGDITYAANTIPAKDAKPVDKDEPVQDEKSGCKKDASLLIMSLIGLSSLLMLFKKRR